jgi:osmotically-inducible protein OsmY
MNIQMKKIVMAGALIAAASAVSAQAADASAATRQPWWAEQAADDQRINDAVIAAIANDSSLDGQIVVHTEGDGQVTLTGVLSTPGQIERARRDAESVAGVRDVDDQVNALVGQNF